MGQGRALSDATDRRGALRTLGAPTRRGVIGAIGAMAGAAAIAPFAACSPRGESPADAVAAAETAARRIDGGWVGASADRGHLLRASKSGTPPPPAVTRRAGAVVVGAGVSGLAAARALVAAGVDDVHLLELEDAAGGNARGHAIAGMRCPLGAHYLPVPGERAIEVAALLDELGVRKRVHGRAVYDERMLCHSPQERLFVADGWREGLLPPVDALPATDRAATLAAYRRFSAAVASFGDDAFAMPTARSTWSDALAALDLVTFAQWLDREGLVAPALRWYLDYCCRDDYGAGSRQVSAWAGLHYFASRHGFRAPGGEERPGDSGDGVLAWPEGNAWLAERMAAPLRDRVHVARVVTRIAEGRDEVVVDAWNAAAGQDERWLAPRVVVALPLFVASRLMQAPPPALVEASRRLAHAPWLVTNLHLETPLDDRPGAPLSWDNVVYGSPALGYVDAMHQSLRAFAGPTVLTAYWALGGDDAAALAAARARLLGDGWRNWAGRVVADLAAVHPDLPGRVVRADLMRYGHAMAIPTPGARGSAALAELARPQRRVQFAHADLSSYSTFEEAIYQGTRAGRAAAGLGGP